MHTNQSQKQVETVSIEEEIKGMRSCLEQLGITVWERRGDADGTRLVESMPGDSINQRSVDKESMSSHSVVPDSKSPGSQTSVPASDAGELQRTRPGQLMDLAVVPVDSPRGGDSNKDLILVRSAGAGSNNLVPDTDERQLLQRMMEAMGLARPAWELYVEVAEDTQIKEPAVVESLEKRLVTSGSSFVLLLVPAAALPEWHRRFADAPLAASDGTGVIEIPATEVRGKTGVAAICDLGDLLINGEQKRGAWESLKAVRQWLSQHRSAG